MRNLILILVLFLNVSLLRGQKDVADFLKAPGITKSLTKEYLNPMAEMLSSSLHSGWYSTAKTHRFLGFDVSLNMSTSSTPINKRGYYLTQIPGFDQNYTMVDGSFSIAANMAGQTSGFPSIKSKADGREIRLPKGEGVDKISLPLLSAGIGLPYNTELRLKLMPKIDKGSIGRLSQYGIGVKHSIKDYIPGINAMPALSLSVLGAYSSVLSNVSLQYPSATVSRQLLKGTVSGITGKLILGFDVPVLSAYMGLGYVSTTADYALKGSYFVGDVAAEQEVQNPVSVAYEYGMMQIDFGIKAKVRMIEVFAAYCPGEYATFTFGGGVNFK